MFRKLNRLAFLIPIFALMVCGFAFPPAAVTVSDPPAIVCPEILQATPEPTVLGTPLSLSPAPVAGHCTTASISTTGVLPMIVKVWVGTTVVQDVMLFFWWDTIVTCWPANSIGQYYEYETMDGNGVRHRQGGIIG